MSGDIQKADQLAFHFYTKFFYTLHDARTTEGARAEAKTDKWFSLETPDGDLRIFTNEARMPYRAISLAPAPGPPVLEIQVLLAVPELPNDQVLVYAVPDAPRVKVEPARHFILLETWTLGMDCVEGTDLVLPTIYKHGIFLFRSLFSLLRVLPAWKLYKRLKRRAGGINRNGKLSMQLRVRPQDTNDERDVLKFGVPPSPFQLALPTKTHTFPPVPHTLGNFIMSTTYLEAPHFFQLDERETVLFSWQPLSSGWHHQRESISGSGAVAAFGMPAAWGPGGAGAKSPKQHGVGSHSYSHTVHDTSNSSPVYHVPLPPNITVPRNQRNTASLSAPIPIPSPPPIPARDFIRNNPFHTDFTDSLVHSRVHLLTGTSTKEFLDIQSLDGQEEEDILPHEKMEADNIFRQLDPNSNGYIETAVAAKFLMGSYGLPLAELGRVWLSAHLNRDSRLTPDDFAIVIRLIKQRLEILRSSFLSPSLKLDWTLPENDEPQPSPSSSEVRKTDFSPRIPYRRQIRAHTASSTMHASVSPLASIRRPKRKQSLSTSSAPPLSSLPGPSQLRAASVDLLSLFEDPAAEFPENPTAESPENLTAELPASPISRTPTPTQIPTPRQAVSNLPERGVNDTPQQRDPRFLDSSKESAKPFLISPTIPNSHRVNPFAYAQLNDLSGKITKEGPVGGGSFADVYMGSWLTEPTPTKVAIKELRSHIYGQANIEKLDKRLRRELRIWGNLNHRNIVSLLGVTSDFGRTAMVCQWMSQGTLSDYLEKEADNLNLQMRLDICIDIADGLSYLHSQKVIHGDLTPVNVLMDNNIAHLSDFGLSNVIDELQGPSFFTSKVGGSARWIAPELLQDATPATSSDVYSFGSVAFYAITGMHPYAHLRSEHAIVAEIFKSINKSPSRPAQALLLTDDCWEILTMCWATDPAERPDVNDAPVLPPVINELNIYLSSHTTPNSTMTATPTTISTTTLRRITPPKELQRPRSRAV